MPAAPASRYTSGETQQASRHLFKQPPGAPQDDNSIFSMNLATRLCKTHFPSLSFSFTVQFSLSRSPCPKPYSSGSSAIEFADPSLRFSFFLIFFLTSITHAHVQEGSYLTRKQKMKPKGNNKAKPVRIELN